MSLFNAIYTMGSGRTEQPIYDNSTITIVLANQGAYGRTVMWVKDAVTFPLRAIHGVYNTLFVAASNINAVAAHQIYSGNVIHYMPFFRGIKGHIVTSDKVIEAIGRHFRHDPEGFFKVEEESENMILPILKDLFPEQSVCPDDLLLTCSRKMVKPYRNLILNYVGPSALPRLRPQITSVAIEVIEAFIKESEGISAKTFTTTYTAAIIARLFLDHQGTLQELQEIGSAASNVSDHQITKKWGKLSSQQVSQYAVSLEILRRAIGQTKGTFREALEASGLSSIQANGELFLLYGAGADTTTSSLQYILWRLGQDIGLQDDLRKGTEEDLKTFIRDCFQEYTPVSFFSRFARQELSVNVRNPDDSVWEYRIPEGDMVIMAPHLTGKDFFGKGKHECPGQWLARGEMHILVAELLKRVVINSFPIKNELSRVPKQGLLGLEPITLSFQERS